MSMVGDETEFKGAVAAVRRVESDVLLCVSIAAVASCLAFNPSRAVASASDSTRGAQTLSYAECGWLGTSAGFVFIRLAYFDQSASLIAGTLNPRFFPELLLKVCYLPQQHRACRVSASRPSTPINELMSWWRSVEIGQLESHSVDKRGRPPMDTSREGYQTAQRGSGA